FFSSRRRHTRWPRDWSSDVCSSDLAGAADKPLPQGRDRRFEGKEAAHAERIQKDFQDAGRELAETHARALREKELQPPLERLRRSEERRVGKERKRRRWREKNKKNT